MRVALYVHCFFPEHFYGTETYTLQLAKNLVDIGHEPIVISAVFPGEKKREAFITRYEFEGIPVYCLDKNYCPPTIRETYHQPTLFEAHSRLLAEIKPDVIHVTHLLNHTTTLLDAARQAGIPTVATLTDFYGICFNQRLEGADGSLCKGPSPDRSNCLACYLKIKTDQWLPGVESRDKFLPLITHSVKKLSKLGLLRKTRLTGLVNALIERPNILLEAYKTYSMAIAPTILLKNAYRNNGMTVPLKVIHFGVDIPRSPKRIPLGKAPVRFGFVGQIAFHKGIDLLLAAFAGLPEQSAELYVYGSVESGNNVSLLKKQNLSDNIHFKGTFPSNKFPEILAQIDCLVIPSRWHENSPLVLLNALATHTPVIVSNVEGMTEFVTEGVNGFIFSRGDEEDLARVLANAAMSPEILRKMSDTTEYPRTTRQMTNEVVEIYKSVMVA